LGVSTIKVEIVGGEWLTFYLGATATINSSTSWSVVQTSTAVVYGQPQGGTTVQKVVSGLKTTKVTSSKSFSLLTTVGPMYGQYRVLRIEEL
jgi:hypothetical protein